MGQALRGSAISDLRSDLLAVIKVVCRRQIFACVQTSPISFVASLRSDQEYVAPAAAHKNHVHNIWLDKIKIILSFIVREYSSDISQ